MKKPLFIFPFAGSGLEALDCVDEAIFDWLGFIDDDPTKQGTTPEGWRVFGREVLAQHPEALLLAVQGSPDNYLHRASVIDSFGLPPERFATVIHPSSQVSRYAQMGYNCLLMAGVVVTPKAVVGNHVVIMPQTVIHHESILGDYTCLGAGVVIAGGCRISPHCWIGSGTTVKQQIEIGTGALVGIGSTVIRSVAAKTVVAGNPAKELRR